MLSMIRLLAVLLTTILLNPGTLPAAEVVNLKTQFSSSRLTIEYDLVGKGSEKSSAVDVQMELKGKKYSSNMLSISGDFGAAIALGSHRQIIWNHLQDFPEGLDYTFKCRVNAIPAKQLINETLAPAEGFRAAFYAVNRQTVVDTRAQLMWTRNGNLSVKPMIQRDALKFIEQLNRERFAGYNDWRMPTREDFERLFYWAKKDGWGHGFEHYIADYLDTCGFFNLLSGHYWTSTADESKADHFFVANTWNGITRPLEQANYYHVWPVRGAQ